MTPTDLDALYSALIGHQIELRIIRDRIVADEARLAETLRHLDAIRDRQLGRTP